MQIDLSPAHARFAAYQVQMTPELFDSPFGQYIIEAQRESAGFARDQLAQQREISMAELAQRSQASQASASAQRAASAASTRNAQISANAQLQAAKMQHEFNIQRLKELEIPQMEINRIDVEGKLKILAQQQALNEQQLAANVVETAAKMGGPGDWVQAWNYARGIGQTQIPEYLKLLANGGNTFDLSGEGIDVPAAQSYGSLINQLSGGTGSSQGAGTLGSVGGVQTRDWAQINSLADSLIRNPGKIAMGGLEGLTQAELQGLGSLVKARGGDVGTFMDQYSRARFGVGNSALAAA